MNPALSIVIPTHKRPVILHECLKRIEQQTMRDQLEVIVVSDGKGDNETAQVAKASWQMPVTFLEMEKSQQGTARNRGVEKAKGEIAMFIGDDIFLEPDACEKHMAKHSKTENRKPIAVLGFTTWDPALTITPVMRWLESSGWQFGYGKLKPGPVPRDRQHFFTYTSHISLPCEVALAHRFREDVTLYGWEDVEWGKRLADAGVELVYEPNAKALHHHPMTLEDSLKRMTTLGMSAVIIEQLNPSLNIVPKGFKKFLLQWIALLPTFRGRHTAALLSGVQKKLDSNSLNS